MTNENIAARSRWLSWRKIQRTGRALGLAVIAIAALLVAHDALAGGFECVRECRAQASHCRFDNRESLQMCLEDSGCVDLRGAFRDACFIVDRDDVACDEARSALMECVSPCRDFFLEDVAFCRDETSACVDDCDITRPEPPKSLRPADREPSRSFSPRD